MQKTNVNNNNNNTALAKSIGFTILALVAVVAMLTTVTVIGGLQTVQAEPEPKTYCKEGTGGNLVCVIGGTNQDTNEPGDENLKKFCLNHFSVPGSDFGEGKCSRHKELEQ
jgi:hypothetical protein